MMVILSLGVVAGLAASTRGDLSHENETDVLKVSNSSNRSHNSTFSFMVMHYIRHYGL
jgi:hypothetical protein